MEEMLNLTDGLTAFFFIWAAVLIFFMKVGFAMLEIGQIRVKNTGTQLTLKFLDLAAVIVVYYFIGYSIAYALPNIGIVPEENYAHFMKMLMFAAAAVTIMTGALAERVKIVPYIIAAIIIGGFGYPIVEHLAWGGGFLANIGFHDFAGSAVVHAFGGIIGFTAAYIIGARIGKYRNGASIPIAGHNVPFAVLGAWILAVGWFGFNIGSISSFNDWKIGLSVAVATTLAMAGGIMGAAIMSKGDPLFIANGAAAGLVAICAGADVVHPVGGLFIGFIAGVLLPVVYKFIDSKLKIDDVCAVTPVHAVSGIWGTLAAGIFGLKIFGGTGGVNILSQFIGIFIIIAIAGILALLVFGILKFTIGIREKSEVERKGLDSQFGIEMYPEHAMKYNNFKF
ncbi:Ammonium transporter [groundwater metagenome]|uniref:Ammonium transporter n=1 Tax=groundwater metagenome TaxID=717931 RepID=A0A098EBW2_9ZZZZ